MAITFVAKISGCHRGWSIVSATNKHLTEGATKCYAAEAPLVLR